MDRRTDEELNRIERETTADAASRLPHDCINGLLIHGWSLRFSFNADKETVAIIEKPNRPTQTVISKTLYDPREIIHMLNGLIEMSRMQDRDKCD